MGFCPNLPLRSLYIKSWQCFHLQNFPYDTAPQGVFPGIHLAYLKHWHLLLL